MTSNTLLAWQAAADAFILSRIFQSMNYRFERFSEWSIYVDAPLWGLLSIG
jgi:hypothetical protein